MFLGRVIWQNLKTLIENFFARVCKNLPYKKKYIQKKKRQNWNLKIRRKKQIKGKCEIAINFQGFKQQIMKRVLLLFFQWLALAVLSP